MLLEWFHLSASGRFHPAFNQPLTTGSDIGEIPHVSLPQPASLSHAGPFSAVGNPIGRICCQVTHFLATAVIAAGKKGRSEDRGAEADSRTVTVCSWDFLRGTSLLATLHAAGQPGIKISQLPLGILHESRSKCRFSCFTKRSSVTLGYFLKLLGHNRTPPPCPL